MISFILAAVAFAVAQLPQQQPPLPPMLGIPKPIHEPTDVKMIPSAPSR